MWPSERLLLEIHIQQWMGCSDAMAHSFGPGRTRVRSRRSASVCPSISRAGRFQDADLVLFRFPIASSLIGIKWGFVFISLLTSKIWILHLFFCLCVSCSGSFQFISFDSFFSWGWCPFLVDLQEEFLVFQILIPCQLQTLQIPSLILFIIYQLSPCCPSQNIININTVKIVHVYLTIYAL